MGTTTQIKFDMTEEDIETSAATNLTYKEEDIPEEIITTTLFNYLDSEESTPGVIQKKQNVDVTKTTLVSEESTVGYEETETEGNLSFETKIVEDIDQILEIYQNITESKPDNFEENKDGMEYSTTAGYIQSTPETRIDFTEKELEVINEETSVLGNDNKEKSNGD